MPSGRVSSAKRQRTQSSVLYVGGLPRELLSFDNLETELAQFGRVESVKDLSTKDDRGKPFHYAFVIMSSIAGAKLAVDACEDAQLKYRPYGHDTACVKYSSDPQKHREFATGVPRMPGDAEVAAAGAAPQHPPTPTPLDARLELLLTSIEEQMRSRHNASGFEVSGSHRRQLASLWAAHGFEYARNVLDELLYCLIRYSVHTTPARFFNTYMTVAQTNIRGGTTNRKTADAPLVLPDPSAPAAVLERLSLAAGLPPTSALLASSLGGRLLAEISEANPPEVLEAVLEAVESVAKELTSAAATCTTDPDAPLSAAARLALLTRLVTVAKRVLFHRGRADESGASADGLRPEVAEALRAVGAAARLASPLVQQLPPRLAWALHALSTRRSPKYAAAVVRQLVAPLREAAQQMASAALVHPSRPAELHSRLDDRVGREALLCYLRHSRVSLEAPTEAALQGELTAHLDTLRRAVINPGDQSERGSGGADGTGGGGDAGGGDGGVSGGGGNGGVSGGGDGSGGGSDGSQASLDAWRRTKSRGDAATEVSKRDAGGAASPPCSQALDTAPDMAPDTAPKPALEAVHAVADTKLEAALDWLPSTPELQRACVSAEELGALDVLLRQLCLLDGPDATQLLLGRAADDVRRSLRDQPAPGTTAAAAAAASNAADSLAAAPTVAARLFERVCVRAAPDLWPADLQRHVEQRMAHLNPEQCAAALVPPGGALLVQVMHARGLPSE